MVDIFRDDEGRWIKVRYGRTVKELSPDHSDLRLSAPDKSSSVDSKLISNRPGVHTHTSCEPQQHTCGFSRLEVVARRRGSQARAVPDDGHLDG